MAKCVRCAAGVEHEFKHGSSSGYGYHDCRCEKCQEYRRELKRRQYAADPKRSNERCAEYRNANRDKVRVAKRKYYEANRGYIIHRSTLYQQENSEKVKRQRQEYRTNNPEKLRERNSAWHAQHPGYRTAYARLYREENPEYARLSRRVATVDVTPRHGARWTPEEDAVLALDDVTYLEMAYLLGRTLAAVSTRRSLLRNKGILA